MARPANGRSRGRNPRQRGGQQPLWGSEIFARPESNRYLLVVGFFVRRRAEFIVITVGWLVFVQLNNHVTPGLPDWMTPAHWALLLMATTLMVVLAVPMSRRYTLGRARAAMTRHRMRACFLQTRTWTANGRLPFLMWSRPSRVGERVRVWLPAGMSVKDLERIIDELAAACWAREARITPIRGQAALVVVDIVRHDPLGKARALTPPVLDHLDGAPAPDPAHGPHPVWTPVSIPMPPNPAPQVSTAGSPNPATGTNGARVTTTKASTTKASTNGSGAARGTEGPADPPAVTGFGGVDVTDYV